MPQGQECTFLHKQPMNMPSPCPPHIHVILPVPPNIPSLYPPSTSPPPYPPSRPSVCPAPVPAPLHMSSHHPHHPTQLPLPWHAPLSLTPRKPPIVNACSKPSPWVLSPPPRTHLISCRQVSRCQWQSTSYTLYGLRDKPCHLTTSATSDQISHILSIPVIYTNKTRV